MGILNRWCVMQTDALQAHTHIHIIHTHAYTHMHTCLSHTNELDCMAYMVHYLLGGSHWAWHIWCTIHWEDHIEHGIHGALFIGRITLSMAYMVHYSLRGSHWAWHIIIIIIIKRGWQCKAGRERLTPYQSEHPNPTTPTHRKKEEKGKTVGDKKGASS